MSSSRLLSASQLMANKGPMRSRKNSLTSLDPARPVTTDDEDETDFKPLSRSGIFSFCTNSHEISQMHASSRLTLVTKCGIWFDAHNWRSVLISFIRIHPLWLVSTRHFRKHEDRQTLLPILVQLKTRRIRLGRGD